MQEPTSPLAVAVLEGAPNVVKVVGELDLATVPTLRAELQSLTGDVELHCDRLTFVDSSGLSLFVDVHHACTERGDAFVLRGVPPMALRTIQASGLGSTFHIRN